MTQLASLPVSPWFAYFLSMLGAIVLIMVAFWCLLFAWDTVYSWYTEGQDRARREQQIRELATNLIEWGSPYDGDICWYCASTRNRGHESRCEWIRLSDLLGL